jgi:hypothetical protein
MGSGCGTIIFWIMVICIFAYALFSMFSEAGSDILGVTAVVLFLIVCVFIIGIFIVIKILKSIF